MAARPKSCNGRRCATTHCAAATKWSLVVPSEPLREGREYEFEFHHSGKVILDAGDRVFYVSARGNWYPAQGSQFASYDLLFRYPRDLDLVTPGDVVEDRTEGEQRITRRRTSAPIRIAGFNLGDYDHVRVARGGYEVDVCANRTLETALQPRIRRPILRPFRRRPGGSRAGLTPLAEAPPPPVTPQLRLQQLAAEVASAMEFMASKFGPPALPRLTVSPIPGTFGQGFPGLIYLSTLSYLKDLPAAHPAAPQQELFFAGRTSGARDGAPVVGQSRQRRRVSRLLAHGGSGQLLRPAVPGKEQGPA